ncbi:hypothetical protein VTN96DRAFT_6393 [Rasamsonia emersonii]
MTSNMDSLKKVLSNILESGSFSDLTLICGSKIFRVHCCIICPQSKFFCKALDGPFQEASSRTITLHDDDPSIVEKMLHYLYEANYEDGSASSPFEITCTDNQDEILRQEESTKECRTSSIQKNSNTFEQGNRAHINAQMKSLN